MVRKIREFNEFLGNLKSFIEIRQKSENLLIMWRNYVKFVNYAIRNENSLFC